MAHIVIDARIINSTTGRYVERLLTYLQDVDKDNTYTVLILNKDIDYWKPKNNNFTVKTADFDQFSLAEQFAYKKFLDGLDADLVHFCMPQQPIFYHGKKITTIHDLILLRSYSSDKNPVIYKIKQVIGHFVFHSVIKRNYAVITDSDNTKLDLVSFDAGAAAKTRVIHLAADNIDSPSRKVDLPYEKFILYVGRQADHKNIRRLAKSHQRLLKKYPNLGLVLVGGKDKAAQMNEDYFKDKDFKNIHYTGFVSNEELAWLYKNCEAYIFPSLMEGFGLPGLEAMGCGAPVVSSSATCLPEIYGDGAHYFNPLDVGDIARAIDEVLSDDKLRNELIEKGYEQIKKYSWEKMARETHAVYLKALKD